MGAVQGALAVLAVAALLGMTLLYMALNNKRVSVRLLFAHGILAAIGIILLLFYTFTRTPGPIESLVIFIIAAVAGALMGYKTLTGKSVPKWIAVAHGVIALGGYFFLLSFLFGWMNP
jgi:uncharacterized membrane protein